MKKKLLVAITALLALIAIVSCDMGGGTVTYIDQVPEWLANKTLYTDTGNSARDEAEVGDEYFVGVTATTNSISLIYRVKGANAGSDRQVTYHQWEVASKIDPSYTPSSAIYYSSSDVVEIYAIGEPGAILRISRDYDGSIYFYYYPTESGAKTYRILKK